MPLSFHPKDLVQLCLDQPDVRIIDVRTPGEFATGHIPGSYNIPLPQLATHRAEIRSACGPVVLVRRSGSR